MHANGVKDTARVVISQADPIHGAMDVYVYSNVYSKCKETPLLPNTIHAWE